MSLRFLQSLLSYTAERGLSKARLCEAAGVAECWLEEPFQRLPAEQAIDLFESAALLLQDPLLGFKLGQTTKPWHYDMLGFILLNAPDLGSAMLQVQKYEALVSDIGEVELRPHPRGVEVLWHTTIDQRQARQLVEENIVSWIVLARWLCQHRTSPLKVSFQHENISDISNFEELFGCPVLFGQAFSGLLLSPEMLQLPISRQDTMLQSILKVTADAQLIELQQHSIDSIRSITQKHLIELLAEGPPTLAALACRLGISSRTLQRRLQQENLSFSELLDNARRQVALRYVAETSMPLQIIATLAGFSEQSAFHRAFKRWTGHAPGRYRQQTLV